MDEDKLLIDVIREYPLLYDSSDPCYHDSKKKDMAWKQISKQFNSMTASDCRKKWIAFRDSFRKSYKKRMALSAESSKRVRPWKYETAMSFIIPHLAPRNLTSNPAGDSDETDDSSYNTGSADKDIGIRLDKQNENAEERLLKNEGPSVTKLPQKFSSGVFDRNSIKKDVVKEPSYSSITQLLDEYVSSEKNKLSCSIPTKTEDALSSFFKAMEETVRTFTLPMQIEIKGKIANLVNDYELRNYHAVQSSFKAPDSACEKSSNWSQSSVCSPDLNSIATPPT